ncbi:STAS domain-containing protein [Candidatus Chlamydia sanziniae]|uniref:Anti-sigma factor antagonist n=1 Tax=Candidatus Chlamydia sanziniae TaxID=1806891 RepID=A0A1A9HUN9_9CHLA|nr:STAS domain-containing protein [Candidatus Chlamydia sanziniae]ANH78708.1 Anti-sigma F factor antagonist RsbV [Candidatus Chlamydia sanziniae]
MDFSTKKYGDILVIYLRGSLDAVSVPNAERFLEQFMHQEHSKLVFNLKEVSYISSAGIRLFLSMFKVVQNLQGKLCLCCVQESVGEVMRIAGLDQMLLLCQTEQECFSKF